MSRFWSPIVSELEPYVAGEQPKIPGIVKLNTNENPYGPSPRVIEALAAGCGDGLRLYPEPTGMALREAVGDFCGLSKEQVFVGNGSDEVLAFAFLAFFTKKGELLFPDVTYSFYPVYCGLYGIPFRTVPLNERFEIDVTDYAGNCGGIIFANPNAPTGVFLSLSQVRVLLDDHPDCVVVVDEAYVDFGGESAVSLIARYPNLLVVQTLSKARSLAGLRVGLAMGQRHLIEALERVKDSFNSYPLGRPAQAGAIASVLDDAAFQAGLASIVATRGRMTAGLEALGFEVLPSAANFVFARHPAHGGADLAAALRGRAILVRRFNAPRIADHLRITVGTDSQTEALLSALAEIPAA